MVMCWLIESEIVTESLLFFLLVNNQPSLLGFVSEVIQHRVVQDEGSRAKAFAFLRIRVPAHRDRITESSSVIFTLSA